jgi:hypothetical protein
MSDHVRERIARRPGRRVVIERTGGTQLGTLDAADGACRDQQKMRAAFAVRHYCEAGRIGIAAHELDGPAGGRVVMQQPVGQTLLLHDEPQSVARAAMEHSGADQRAARRQREQHLCHAASLSTRHV